MLYRIPFKGIVKYFLLGGVAFLSGIIAATFAKGIGPGLLNAMIVLLLLYVGVFAFAVFILNFNQCEPKERAQISAQFLIFIFATFIGLITLRVNRRDSQCLEQIRAKEEISELLITVTDLLQNKMGLPEACFDNKGGTVIPIVLDEYGDAFELYRERKKILHEKFNSFVILTQRNPDPYSNFLNATAALEQTSCGERNSKFHDIWRSVTTTSIKLREELNVAILNCLN